MSSVGSFDSNSASGAPGQTQPVKGGLPARPGNPFEGDVVVDLLELTEATGGVRLNEEALERVAAMVEEGSGAGTVVLLTAPKAGFGKTHLLGRVAAALKSQVTMMPVRFSAGDALTLTTVSQRGIEALLGARMAREGWTALREVSGEAVARLMHGLIGAGRLACANQEQALRVLAGPVVEIFDAKGAAKPIGDWVRQNLAQLSAPMAALATERVSAERGLSPLWIEALLEQAAEGGAAGVATLHELAGNETAGDGAAWLRLAGIARRVAVVLDHVDGFHRDLEAGVKLGALAVELAEVHGLRVVLSVNQDVWQATMGSHLPSALEDRLTASAISLRGVAADAAAELVRARLQGAGVEAAEAAEFERFLALDRHFLGRPVGSVPVRAVLRHAARQWEMFKHSLPPPPDDGLAASGASSGDGSMIPLISEGEDGPIQVPAIFDEATTSYVKDMAQGLADGGQPTGGTTPADRPADVAEPPAAEGAPEGSGGSDAGMAPSADAFEKLREMLGKLRQPASADGAAGAAMEPSGASPVVGVMEAPAPRGEEAAVSAKQGDVLLGRFEALRLQMRAEAEVQPLDLTKIAELIRLAGRRFPLVRFSEPELLGMSGRQVMVWTLQGVEIVFGLGAFSDGIYWKAVAGYVAERQAELGTEPTVKVKLVTFKTDREQAAYQAMMYSGVLRDSVMDTVDAVHLDPGSVASLYAMQRIIKEAETGALDVEPARVMSALARELDFFWRRVTRLG